MAHDSVTCILETKGKNQAVKILMISGIWRRKEETNKHLELEVSRIILHGEFISLYNCQST